MSEAFPQSRMSFVYGVCHYVIRVIYDIAFRGEAHGLENLPRDKGFIVACNHASHLDPPLVGCHIPRQMCFFARKTLWKPGLASWWLDTVGTIPVDRDGGSDIQAMKRVLRAIAGGKVLILFPEGTRTSDGAFQKPKPGVGFMACRTGVTVVPARVFGSFKAFGKGGPLRLGSPVSVVYGRPFESSTYDRPADGKERYQRASERIFERIAELQLPPDVVV